MKHFFLLFISLGLALPCTYAQDVNGKWIGFLYQDAKAVDTLDFGEIWRNGERNGKGNFYAIELFFSAHGNAISGTYHITADFDSSLTALFLLSGTWQKNKKIITYLADDKEYGISAFCYNKANLKYYEKDSFQYLEGPWEGWTSNTCNPGIVAVWKPISTENKQAKEPSRKVEITDRLQVSDSVLVVEIWDNEYEDGDIITLKLNDKIVLSNHLVTKQIYTLRLPLTSDYNLLEMAAVNTGNNPPNTAALRIKDGEREQVFILKSDMRKSEAILIRRNNN